MDRKIISITSTKLSIINTNHLMVGFMHSVSKINSLVEQYIKLFVVKLIFEFKTGFLLVES